MNTWHKLVHDAHKRDHQDDGFDLVTGPPAEPDAITQLQNELGFTLPVEFRALYETFDGVGVTSDHEETDWLLTPIGDIPKVMAEARDWFQDTHPAQAKVFFPFINWGTGDYSGYCLSDTGDLLPGIWDFQHEAYEFEEDQPASEFLVSVYERIEEILAG